MRKELVGGEEVPLANKKQKERAGPFLLEVSAGFKRWDMTELEGRGKTPKAKVKEGFPC